MNLIHLPAHRFKRMKPSRSTQHVETLGGRIRKLADDASDPRCRFRRRGSAELREKRWDQAIAHRSEFAGGLVACLGTSRRELVDERGHLSRVEGVGV